MLHKVAVDLVERADMVGRLWAKAFFNSAPLLPAVSPSESKSDVLTLLSSKSRVKGEIWIGRGVWRAGEGTEEVQRLSGKNDSSHTVSDP